MTFAKIDIDMVRAEANRYPDSPVGRLWTQGVERARKLFAHGLGRDAVVRTLIEQHGYVLTAEAFVQDALAVN